MSRRLIQVLLHGRQAPTDRYNDNNRASEMDEKRTVIYRYCKVCGRATQRFSVVRTESAKAINERGQGV